jgi:transposase
MATATVEIQIDVPAGITIGEYERIDQGHAFHVSWELPDLCCCETCKREAPLQQVDKDKFLAIRDLDLWGQPSFFVYQEMYHRCACGHRQSLIPPFKRRDVKYTRRFEEYVVTSLIGSTAEDVAQRLGISAETVERIVRNVHEDSRAKKIDPARTFARLGMDEISLRKGHKGYATILTDLSNPGKVEILAVSKGRDEEAGNACLNGLSPEQRLAVQFHHTDMSPAFSQDFLKRLSAFSKLSSGSTITLVTRNSPLSRSPKALVVYHAPPRPATDRGVLGVGGLIAGVGG